MTKRLIPLGLVGMLSVITAGGAAHATGGGYGYVPPGNYNISDSSAWAGFFNADGSASGLYVEQGTPLFVPETGIVDLRQGVTVLMVYLQPDAETTPMEGCFVIPNSDF